MTTTVSTITRRIAVALAGPAVATGLLAGAVALGAPANAAPQGPNCVTAKVTPASPDATVLLTRPGQIDEATGMTAMTVTATSCLSH